MEKEKEVDTFELGSASLLFCNRTIWFFNVFDIGETSWLKVYHQKDVMPP